MNSDALLLHTLQISPLERKNTSKNNGRAPREYKNTPISEILRNEQILKIDTINKTTQMNINMLQEVHNDLNKTNLEQKLRQALLKTYFFTLAQIKKQ